MYIILLMILYGRHLNPTIFATIEINIMIISFTASNNMASEFYALF